MKPVTVKDINKGSAYMEYESRMGYKAFRIMNCVSIQHKWGTRNDTCSGTGIYTATIGGAKNWSNALSNWVDDIKEVREFYPNDNTPVTIEPDFYDTFELTSDEVNSILVLQI